MYASGEATAVDPILVRTYFLDTVTVEIGIRFLSAKETSLYATTYRGGSSCDVEDACFGFRVEFNTLSGNSIRSGSIDDVTRSDEFMGVSKELQLICIELPIFLLDLNGSNKTDMISMVSGHFPRSKKASPLICNPKR